ncbi:MAG: proline--tRNA ligase [Candidatus Altiarchaeota archaeon]|nr:proline--tRNA ligase [Candidatus Altiarchaeota archaeon]
MSEELGITAKKENMSEWYQQLVLRAGFADYSPVKGSIIYRPWSYAIWEKMMESFNAAIKAHGVENAYFPLLIPESFLKKEAEHFAGFTPEVAWVTMAGENKLDERLAIRPTSETIMYYMFAKWIQSYRDLPFKVNQWCNIMRWETKMTKPFLRGREFLWQEGHTVHTTKTEAETEAEWAIEAYKKLVEGLLAVPVVTGKKTESDKFAGAVYTITVESLMPDGRALQIGTSHMLGQNFSKPFEVKFLGKDEKNHYAWQTSWGLSTRILGGLIMVHGDDKGAVLPPKVAPIQLVIVPILFKETEKQVIAECERVKTKLEKKGIRVKLDDRPDYSAGWKFNHWELKGVPLRVELGPKDLEKKSIVLVRRDTGVKTNVKQVELVKTVLAELDKMQTDMFEKAKGWLDKHTVKTEKAEELEAAIISGKWAILPHCANIGCEEKMTEKFAGGPSLVIDKKITGKICIGCGKPAKYWIYWAKSY